MFHQIQTEIFSYWEKIKQNPLYSLLILFSLWAILPFSFWLLRGEPVKNLDSLIQELTVRQEDIKKATVFLEEYRTTQKIALTQIQRDSFYRLMQEEESSFRSFLLLFFTKVPLFLFFLLLGALLERHFHWSARFEKTAPAPVRASKIKIYSPAPTTGSSTPSATPTTPTTPPPPTSASSQENSIPLENNPL